MPLVSSSIPNLVNGVSQQPATLRLASQAALQLNGLSTVSQGLKKRPPTKHVKKLGPPISGTAFIHTINRDQNEQYEVIITNGDLHVYDMAGNEKEVSFPHGKSYLESSDPATSFRATTVADYTFIVNTKTTVALADSLSPSRPYEALAYVVNGLYSHTYRIWINGVTQATFTTPDGTVAADADKITTDYIAGQLGAQLASNGTPNTVVGSVVYISSSTDFTIRSSDGYSNEALKVLKGKVQNFSDLPPAIAVNGFTIQVAGDANTDDDNYWVRFDSSDGSTGVWRETIQPNIPNALSRSTMPHGLIRLADGTFKFDFLPYDDRLVGDDDTAPQPSFVGKTIRNIFFYRNRLGFLSDESVILSEAGSYFNFYPTTVTTLLDSDPIDVSAAHTKVSLLNFAVPFDKRLLLFSSQTQFSLESGDTLTAKTISIKPTTEYECSTQAAPVGIGRYVYFAVPKGNYEGFREYFVSTTTDTDDATDVTAHVPKYITKGVYKIAPALNEDFLAVLSTGERNVVFTYQYYWNGNQKLQSAWSRWVFPTSDHILNAEFIESTLFLVINRSDGLYLESLSVSLDDVQTNEPYTVHLDRKVSITPAAGSFDGEYTTLPLEWTPSDGHYLAVVATGQSKKAGLILEVDESGRVKGDFTGVNLIVGRVYRFRYLFSPVMIRTQDGQGQKADTVGRLQLRRMLLNFTETGYFEVQVTPTGRNTYTYKFTGKTLGLPSATIGEVGIQDGQFPFRVDSKNDSVRINIVSDSPLPCSFMSADWEGYYVRRSQAV